MRILRAAFVFCAVLSAFAIAVALFHPQSPLPDEWHPLKPLRVSDPVTPLTSWKLDQTARDPTLCLAALENAARMTRLEDKIETPNCGIAPRVLVSSVGSARVADIETTCATALRLAMWQEHGVVPAAEFYLGQNVSRLRHAGSYSCRKMRTTGGGSERWSTHSKAMAIDITGFDLNDGTRLRLIDDWDAPGNTRLFMRAVRDSACQWFGTTLSPDYNSLHADHFHLQSNGWGTCR